MGAEDFGRFSYATSLTGIFLIALDYGYNLFLVKEVSSAREDISAVASSYFSTKVILATAATLILIPVALGIAHDRGTLWVMLILWVSCVFYSFGVYFNLIFRGLNKFEYETYPNLVPPW
jgi:O-antigen/teichoic acid export membrane protein